MTKPAPSAVPASHVSVIVMRPDDAFGSICTPAYDASTRTKKKPRYRCARCLRGLVYAIRGYKCKIYGCHAEVVDIIRRPDKAMTIPRRRAGRPRKDGK